MLPADGLELVHVLDLESPIPPAAELGMRAKREGSTRWDSRCEHLGDQQTGFPNNRPAGEPWTLGPRDIDDE